MTTSIGVIGAGGWGTALAKLLADKGETITLWCHGPETYRDIEDSRENRAYLPGVILPPTVEVTRSLKEVATDKKLLICTVPSHCVRQVLSDASTHMAAEAKIVCGAKGLEEDSLKTMSDVFVDIFGERRKNNHAFLSGPTFALEVAHGLPAAVTVASYEARLGREVQEALSTQSFRVYTSTDVVGVQIGGVVKNVIAIAAGISDGLGLGHNARAALITRGLAEIIRFAARLGADPLTLSGLPGLGDLVLTCTGELSRNRTVGVRIARGESITAVTDATKMVAEGIRNTRSVYLLARRLGVEMPIVEQMYGVLYNGKKPLDAVRDLMQRSLKPEIS